MSSFHGSGLYASFSMEGDSAKEKPSNSKQRSVSPIVLPFVT